MEKWKDILMLMTSGVQSRTKFSVEDDQIKDDHKISEKFKFFFWNYNKVETFNKSFKLKYKMLFLYL